MNIKAAINEDLKSAMKAKDAAALRALRAIKSAFLIAETAEGRTTTGELPNPEALALLQKQAKQRRESIKEFTDKGRADLAALEQEELAVIEKYLPTQLSGPELEARVRDLIAEVGAASPADLGKVMKAAKDRLAGQADGAAVSDAARKLLNA